MRYISDKSYRENQNTHFMFSNIFPKIAPFMRECRKIRCSKKSHKWRHNMAHTLGMLDKQGYTHSHAHVPGHPHTHARPHRKVCNTYCFSTAKMILETLCVPSALSVLYFVIESSTWPSVSSESAVYSKRCAFLSAWNINYSLLNEGVLDF